jgi:hypothetical protein
MSASRAAPRRSGSKRARKNRSGFALRNARLSMATTVTRPCKTEEVFVGAHVIAQWTLSAVIDGRPVQIRRTSSAVVVDACLDCNCITVSLPGESDMCLPRTSLLRSETVEG